MSAKHFFRYVLFLERITGRHVQSIQRFVFGKPVFLNPIVHYSEHASSQGAGQTLNYVTFAQTMCMRTLFGLNVEQDSFISLVSFISNGEFFAESVHKFLLQRK